MKLMIGIALALASIALAVGACTTDDNVIEGQLCDMKKPLNERCVVGYTCQCSSSDLSTCTCVRPKTSKMTQLERRAVRPRPVAGSVSRSFLRRRFPALDFARGPGD